MPTYSDSFYRVTMFGNSFSGAEEWATSFTIGNSTGGDVGQAPTQAYVDSIAALWQTFFTSAASNISSAFTTVGVKVALISTAGTADPGNTVFHYFSPEITGGGGATRMPAQCSIVATLATAKVRGFGSKGRMYLPGGNPTVNADGRFTTTTATAIAGALKTFFDGINALTAPGGAGPYEAVLMSAEVVGVPGRAPEMNPITQIRVGNVYDTQRRRRNQLQEQYSVSVLA